MTASHFVSEQSILESMKVCPICQENFTDRGQAFAHIDTHSKSQCAVHIYIATMRLEEAQRELAAAITADPLSDIKLRVHRLESQAMGQRP